MPEIQVEDQLVLVNAEAAQTQLNSMIGGGGGGGGGGDEEIDEQARALVEICASGGISAAISNAASVLASAAATPAASQESQGSEFSVGPVPVSSEIVFGDVFGISSLKNLISLALAELASVRASTGAAASAAASACAKAWTWACSSACSTVLACATALL